MSFHLWRRCCDVGGGVVVLAAVQWDLVCERRALFSTTQAASFIGKLVGCAFLGYLTDA